LILKIRRIFYHPLIVRIARSGWHLPLSGVAVASQVLCTSTTLNKSFYSVWFRSFTETHSLQSGLNNIHTIARFQIIVKKKTKSVGHIYKIVPRILLSNNNAPPCKSRGFLPACQNVELSRRADGIS